MRLTPLVVCLAAALAVLGLAATGAPAQTLDDKLRAQLTSVLGQLHDLQNAQSGLLAQKAAAERDRDALKAKLAKLGGGAHAVSPAVQAALTAEQGKNARLADQLQQAQTELAKYKDAFDQASQAAQQTRAERDRLAVQSDAGARALADCTTKNTEMLKVSHEILTAYERVGVGQALRRGEPILGLERAKLERIAQGYGDQLYGAKFDPRAVKPGSVASGPAASAGGH